MYCPIHGDRPRAVQARAERESHGPLEGHDEEDAPPGKEARKEDEERPSKGPLGEEYPT
jgi:hypothetical protein